MEVVAYVGSLTKVGHVHTYQTGYWFQAFAMFVGLLNRLPFGVRCWLGWLLV
jgi:hypothetical protein